MLKKIAFAAVGLLLAASPLIAAAQTSGLSDTCSTNPTVTCLQAEIVQLMQILEQLLTSRPSQGSITVSADTQPVNSIAPQGALVPFTYFNLTNTSGSPVTITGLLVETSASTSTVGAFHDVCIQQSEKGGSPCMTATFDSYGQAVISATITIPAYSYRSFTIFGEMADSLSPYNAQPARLSLVSITTSAQVSGSLPVTGATQTINSTLNACLPQPQTAVYGYQCWGGTNPPPAPSSSLIATISPAQGDSPITVYGGTSDLTVGVFTLQPSNEDMDLQQIGLYLVGSQASPSDITRAYVYQGSTLVGSTVFAGTQAQTCPSAENAENPSGGCYFATSTLSVLPILSPNTQSLFTVRVDVAGVGVGQSGKAGDQIKVGLSDAQAVGANSGSIINSGSIGTNQFGARIFKSYPIVSQISLPTDGLSDGRLVRFSVTSASGGAIGLDEIGFNLSGLNQSTNGEAALYAYTDSGYSQPISNGNGGYVGGEQIGPGDTGGTLFFDQPVEIPAGTTYYFELRDSLKGSGLTNESTLTTTVFGQPSYHGIGTVSSFPLNDYFIWSPNDYKTSATSDADWVNGSDVQGLPESGISQMRTGGGSVQPPQFSYPGLQFSDQAQTQSTYNFTFNPGSTAYGYKLNYGDGTVMTLCAPNNCLSGQQVTIHGYATPGTYTVSLYAADTSGNTEVAKTLTVTATSDATSSVTNSVTITLPAPGSSYQQDQYIPLTVSGSVSREAYGMILAYHQVNGSWQALPTMWSVVPASTYVGPGSFTQSVPNVLFSSNPTLSWPQSPGQWELQAQMYTYGCDGADCSPPTNRILATSAMVPITITSSAPTPPVLVDCPQGYVVQNDQCVQVTHTILPTSAASMQGNLSINLNQTSNQYYNIGALPDSQTFTVSAWTWYNGGGNCEVILSDGDATPGNDVILATDGTNVYIRADKSGANLTGGYCGTMGATQVSLGGHNIAQGWHNIVWVNSGSSQSVYLDGSLLSTVYLTGSNIGYHVSGGANVGREFDGTNGSYPNGVDYFDGNIADLRYYVSALSSSQVSAIYSAGMQYGNIALTPITLTGSVLSAPKQSLAASPTSGTAPLSVTFSASGVPSGASISFGDGTTEQTDNLFGNGTTNSAGYCGAGPDFFCSIPHTYASAGSYTATLLGGGSTSTVSINVSANVTPPAPTPSVKKQIILTSGSTWTVPADWNSADNSIEVIGGGGGGGGGDVTGGGGGGGGAYASISNLSLTAGASVLYQIGNGGSGGVGNSNGTPGTDTFFNRLSGTTNSCADNVSVCAKGGAGGAGGTSGADGLGGSGGVGSVTQNGGSGGSSAYHYGGAGGGGAAGPSGVGNNGTNGSLGSVAGGSGDEGSGGIGSANSAGASGAEWGSGYGAGAGGSGVVSAANGGYQGGSYGGGGGGADWYFTGFQGGHGGSGLIVITYTPATTVSSANPSNGAQVASALTALQSILKSLLAKLAQ